MAGFKKGDIMTDLQGNGMCDISRGIPGEDMGCDMV